MNIIRNVLSDWLAEDGGGVISGSITYMDSQIDILLIPKGNSQQALLNRDI